MESDNSECVLLRAYLISELDARSAERFEKHLVTCAECAQEVLDARERNEAGTNACALVPDLFPA